MPSQLSRASRKLACARCDTAFECALNGDCWCAAEPYALPASPAEDCLCPACLRKAAQVLSAQAPAADALARKADPRL